MTRDEIKEILKKGVHSVTFTKVDGTTRVMQCTLDPDLLPPPKEGDEEKVKKEPNLSILPVWDVEKEGWRSFKVDSVTEVL
jgi:hypothetical protein